jgi:hypothetical protein
LDYPRLSLVDERRPSTGGGGTGGGNTSALLSAAFDDADGLHDDSDSDSPSSHSLLQPPSLPSRGIHRLAEIVRQKVLPKVRGKWSSGSIVRRFLAHKYGDFDVSNMLQQHYGAEEFRQRTAARLHHLDSSQTIAATTDIVS